MPGANLSSDWVEAKAALSMVDGKTYVVEFHGPAETRVYALDVEGSSEPTSNEDALVHFNRDEYPAEEPMEFTARAGWAWWLRTDGGASRVVAAEV